MNAKLMSSGEVLSGKKLTAWRAEEEDILIRGMADTSVIKEGATEMNVLSIDEPRYV